MIRKQKNLQYFCSCWLSVWTGNNPEKLLSFYASNAFYRNPTVTKALYGHNELTPYFKKLLSKNPDWVGKD